MATFSLRSALPHYRGVSKKKCENFVLETPPAVGQCRIREKDAPVRCSISFSRLDFVWRILLRSALPHYRERFKEKWENLVLEKPTAITARAMPTRWRKMTLCIIQQHRRHLIECDNPLFNRLALPQTGGCPTVHKFSQDTPKGGSNFSGKHTELRTKELDIKQKHLLRQFCIAPI